MHSSGQYNGGECLWGKVPFQKFNFSLKKRQIPGKEKLCLLSLAVPSLLLPTWDNSVIVILEEEQPSLMKPHNKKGRVER